MLVFHTQGYLGQGPLEAHTMGLQLILEKHPAGSFQVDREISAAPSDKDDYHLDTNIEIENSVSAKISEI